MKTGNLLSRFIGDESGQAISEYGAITAFVAVLVVLVFATSNGGIKGAISSGFSACITQINNLSGQPS
jgi:Flp pilus assembly pilin Flp